MTQTTTTDHNRLAGITRAYLACDTTQAAAEFAALHLRGRTLAGVATLLGVHLTGRADDRRRQLVEQTIGRALTMGAVDGTGAEVALASWRRRKLAELDR